MTRPTPDRAGPAAWDTATLHKRICDELRVRDRAGVDPEPVDGDLAHRGFLRIVTVRAHEKGPPGIHTMPSIPRLF